ncbi:MAG: molecular chaperone HtpG [Lentisphaerae bacterium]|nr:molecular chaperone HtpG [Lentisphaerota bacterium]
MAKDNLQFQTEVQQLLQLMIHSVYSNKDIFIRELVANAADALDKARFESISRPELAREWEIRIAADKDANTLTFIDNGIGMDRDELINNIGTIAKSGTKAFIEAMKKKDEAKANDLELIGQFGVGFYSAFMAASQAEIITKKAGTDQAWKWVSEGKDTYSIEEAERDDQGTTIILHLKDDAKSYLEYWTVSSIIRKYSDFIEYPIKMKHTVKKDDKDVEEDSTLNTMKAIWLRSESEVKDEEYKSFYQHLGQYGDPLKRIVYSAEGTSEFKALLFIPEHAPFDFQFTDRRTNSLQLYVRRVFITDNCPALLPDYLRFVSGVVDSSDLPLNLSREMLQDNPQVHKISVNLTKRILNELTKMLENDRERYEKFYREFGRLIKEGVHTDYANREKLQNLLLFETMNNPSGKLVTLKEYRNAMPALQQDIYYLTGDSRSALENSPHLEILRKQNYDVLFMTDPIDEFVVSGIPEYESKKLKSVNKGEVKFDESIQKELEEKTKKAADDNKSLVEAIKKALGDKVKDVTFSSRLTESACCLVGGDADPSAYMQRVLKAFNRDTPNVARTLELNPDHPLVAAMKRLFEKTPDSPKLTEFSEMLYDQALLAEGSPLPDPLLFAKRTAALMTFSAEKEAAE